MPTLIEYKKMHKAFSELGIDKSQLLADRYGISSAEDLSPRQVGDLLAHLKRLGWKPKPGKKKLTPSYAEAQKRKITALWCSLADAGVVRDRGDAALQRYVKRMTGIARLEWCDDGVTNRVCQSLIEWCKRSKVAHGA